MPKVAWAGGVFQRIHKEMMGVEVDFAAFDPAAHDPLLVEEAVLAWGVRVQTEFRSIQVMTRFTQEVLGAGDPIDVYAGAAEAILDEIRHTALCVGMLEALGGEAELPDPVDEPDSPEFLALPMAQRATADAIAMLAISETLSTGYIRDLQSRCTDPTVSRVLDVTLEDEDAHEAFGWDYIEASMQRCEGGEAFFRMVADRTLRPHMEIYTPILEALPLHLRHLSAFPEPERAALGLLSQQREALVFQQTLQRDLAPRLSALGLLTL